MSAGKRTHGRLAGSPYHDDSPIVFWSHSIAQANSVTKIGQFENLGMYESQWVMCPLLLED